MFAGSVDQYCFTRYIHALVSAWCEMKTRNGLHLVSLPRACFWTLDTGQTDGQWAAPAAPPGGRAAKQEHHSHMVICHIVIHRCARHDWCSMHCPMYNMQINSLSGCLFWPCLWNTRETAVLRHSHCFCHVDVEIHLHYRISVNPECIIWCKHEMKLHVHLSI